MNEKIEEMTDLIREVQPAGDRSVFIAEGDQEHLTKAAMGIPHNHITAT